MTFNASDIHDNVVSIFQQTGLFQQVFPYEPTSAPTERMTAGVWFGEAKPFARGSGASATTGLLIFYGRIYITAFSYPLNQVEKDLLDAINQMFTAFSGDFQLDASVRNIDLLGMTGQSLTAVAGYANVDNTIFRVATITIPLIINDMWAQVP